jgi:fatty-acyl-CoA synthase
VVPDRPIPAPARRGIDGPTVRLVGDRVEAHRVTLMCGALVVPNTILDAAADCSARIPGRGRIRIVVAGAPPPTRTIEHCETELGWEFIRSTVSPRPHRC